MYFAIVGTWVEVPELAKLPMRFVFAIQQWCAVVAAFGFARLHLNRDHPWRAPLTEAVFPLYILHQTLIVALAWWLIPMRLGAGVEATLMVTGTIAGCLLLHEGLIRRSGWLRPLFGLKAMPHTAAPRPLPQPVP